MARTDSAAGRWSSTSPAWVESTVRWTSLVESAASWSWAAAQPVVVERLGGGEDGQRTVAERGERLGLGEDLGDNGQLVTAVPGRLAGRAHGA